MGFRARDRDNGGQARVEHPNLPGPGRRQRRPGDGLTLEDKLVASIEINGGNVVYEILGNSGDLIALTPGGRFVRGPGLGHWPKPSPTAGIGCCVGSAELRRIRRAVLRAERVAHACRNAACPGDQTRLRSVHPGRRLRRRKGFDADHDALPRTRREAGGVEHRRRHLRLVRPGLLLHRPEYSRGARYRNGRRGEGAGMERRSKRTRPTSSGSSISTRTSSSS